MLDCITTMYLDTDTDACTHTHTRARARLHTCTQIEWGTLLESIFLSLLDSNLTTAQQKCDIVSALFQLLLRTAVAPAAAPRERLSLKDGALSSVATDAMVALFYNYDNDSKHWRLFHRSVYAS